VIIGLLLAFTTVAWAIVLIPEEPEGEFYAFLSGEETLPPQATEAWGRATFRFLDGGEKLFFRLEVYDVDDVLMAHLRLGLPGREGPILLWLFPEEPPPTPLRFPGRFNGVLAERVVDASALTGPLTGQSLLKLKEEMANGRTFVQVDTVRHQIGEIRGQVLPVGEISHPAFSE